MGDIIEVSGITYAITAAMKQAGLPGRYAGLAAMMVGVLVGMALAAQRMGATADFATAAVQGLIGGLSSAGFYSGAKAITEKP